MARLRLSVLTASLAFFLASCQTPRIPDVTLSDQTYQPASPAVRSGPLLQASIEVVPAIPWVSMDAGQIHTNYYSNGAIRSWRMSGQIYGYLAKQDLTAELQGVFQTASASDVIAALALNQDKSPDFFAVTAVGSESLPVNAGAMLTIRMRMVTALASRVKRAAVRTYQSQTNVDIPFSVDQRAPAVQNAVEQLTRDIGTQIAKDDQLRSAIELGMYADYSTQITAGEASPYDPEMNAVVRIERDGGIGSGFLINPDGLILTAAHVVGGKTSVTVKTRAGASYTGQVLATDEDRDLALVKISGPGNNFPILKLSTQDTPVTGTSALAIGAPLGLSWSVSKGIVSGVRQLRVARVAQFDTPIDPGDSGGPLIDAATNQVIGVMSFTTSNIGFAILADEAHKAFGASVPQ